MKPEHREDSFGTEEDVRRVLERNKREDEALTKIMRWGFWTVIAIACLLSLCA